MAVSLRDFPREVEYHGIQSLVENLVDSSSCLVTSSGSKNIVENTYKNSVPGFAQSTYSVNRICM
jgi:tetrahydromethanopterin S-methyltransferase subunit A